LGRYEIVGELASGGMGTVFEAFDPRLERPVAIKVLKLDPRIEPEAAARLRLEARAMAHLSHPNVLPVYDIGIEGETCFVTMELVEGTNLRIWQRDRPRSHGDTIAVYIEAARGLAAAHAAGFVHRDFKPSNVLIGHDERVRVMDFGLVRAVDSRSESANSAPQSAVSGDTGDLTAPGDVLGTPAYMAPEQYEGGAIDARTDQYSFCVALYEALYGAKPFGGRTFDEVRRAKLKGEVAGVPREVRRRRRLHAAIMRGLERNPEDRWPSMDALIGELATRRRIVGRSVALVAGLGGLALWSVVSGAEETRTCPPAPERLRGVWDDEQRVSIQAGVEASGQPAATRRFEGVASQLDAYAEEWSAAYDSACRSESNAESSSRDLWLACLDDRLTTLGSVVDELEHADGDSLPHGFDAAWRLPSVDECRSRSAGGPRAPDPSIAAAVRDIREQLAVAEGVDLAGDPGEALGLAKEAVAAARQVGYEPLLAAGLFRQGALEEDGGNYERARDLLEEAYFSAHRSGDLRLAANAATALVFVLGVKLGDGEAGRTWERHARSASELAGLGPGALARLDAMLAGILRHESRYAEAVEQYERAIATYEADEESERLVLAGMLGDLGLALRNAGRYADALAVHERDLAIREAELGTEHPSLAAPLNNRAIVLNDLGRYDEAIESYEHAARLIEHNYGPQHPDLGATLTNLANVLERVGRADEALALHERSVKIFEHAFGNDSPRLIAPLNHLGSAFRDADRLDEAAQTYARALSIIERTYGENHFYAGVVLNNMGRLAESRGDLDDALALIERSRRIMETAVGSDDARIGVILLNVGRIRLAQDRAEDAKEAYARALRIFESRESEPRNIPHARFGLAKALWELGEESRAMQLVEEARREYGAIDGTRDEDLVTVDAWLGEHT
jgi:tetratricopeptide (TPR) repeat protein